MGHEGGVRWHGVSGTHLIWGGVFWDGVFVDEERLPLHVERLRQSRREVAAHRLQRRVRPQVRLVLPCVHGYGRVRDVQHHHGDLRRKHRDWPQEQRHQAEVCEKVRGDVRTGQVAEAHGQGDYSLHCEVVRPHGSPGCAGRHCLERGGVRARDGGRDSPGLDGRLGHLDVEPQQLVRRLRPRLRWPSQDDRFRAGDLEAPRGAAEKRHHLLLRCRPGAAGQV
mmetsp:Transcript_123094/g.353651  ORF Transcript_123094/g.353651 Transcript_123094/m.353651 type:complete len:223 (-) Transcript_123094:320-988(-)